MNLQNVRTDLTECCGAYHSESGCCPFATPQSEQVTKHQTEQHHDNRTS